jgi:ubiquinone/menaquinone biosynthesis C-methylase UbiE
MCERCRLTCLNKGDYYDFMQENSYYWNELPIEETMEFLETANKRGWKAAVRTVNLKHPGFDEYVMSMGRADWIFHCLKPGSTKACLDIGSGWGGIAFALANIFDEVWSLEAVETRIEFQRIRNNQENRNNIKFVRSDWLDLPFPDSYFDVISVNGVLEWVGLSDYSKNPRDLQIKFIQEVKRLLKPGGCLYIGIENRFGLNFFLGSLDHSGLRFTSLLPRKISDAVVRLSKRAGEFRQSKELEKWPDYRTYTYSLWGYRNLLKGFSEVDIYWTNSYNQPKAAGKIEDGSFAHYLRYLRSRDNIKHGFKRIIAAMVTRMPREVLKLGTSLFSSDFLIFAYKGAKGTTFESNLIKLESPHSSFFRLSGGHSMDSKIIYFIFRGGKLDTILKFPRDSKSSIFSSEEEAMSKFNNINVKREIIDSVPVYIEQPLIGKRPLKSNFPQNLMVVNWLLDFQNKTQKGFWTIDQLEKETRKFNKFLADYGCDQPLRLRIEERIEEFLNSMQRTKISITSEHGDFCNENFVIENQKLYVFDWEFYNEYSNPLDDFIFFLLSNCMDDNVPNTFKKNLNCDGEYSPTLIALISIFADSKNLKPEIILQSIPIVILRKLYRNIYKKDSHINQDMLYFLLREWDEIRISATTRILSKIGTQHWDKRNL